MVRHLLVLLSAGVLGFLLWAASSPREFLCPLDAADPAPQTQTIKGESKSKEKAGAQTPKDDSKGKPDPIDQSPKGETKGKEKPAPDAKTPATGQLTEYNVSDQLKALGYDVTVHKSLDGKVSWSIKKKAKDGDYLATLLPVYENKKLTGWVVLSRLGVPLGAAEALSPGALLKVLQRNLDISPYSFAYHEKTGYLCLERSYPLAVLTEKELGKALDDFFAVVRQTEPLWKAGSLQVAGIPKTGDQPKTNPMEPKPSLPIEPKDELIGSFWEGKETLAGYGKLGFYLLPRGGAVMVDAHDTIAGSWAHTGDKLTLQFFSGKVTYEGKLDAKKKSLSGKAVTDDGRTWTFQVTFQGKKAAPVVAAPATPGISGAIPSNPIGGLPTNPLPGSGNPPGISGITPGTPPIQQGNPPGQPAPSKLVGTVWKGSETLEGYGNLTFYLNAGGKATMIDAQETVQGTWEQNGPTIKVHFFEGEVTYQGVLKGQILSGTARNNVDGRTWSFTVTLQPGTGGPPPAGPRTMQHRTEWRIAALAQDYRRERD